MTDVAPRIPVSRIPNKLNFAVSQNTDSLMGSCRQRLASNAPGAINKARIPRMPSLNGAKNKRKNNSTPHDVRRIQFAPRTPITPLTPITPATPVNEPMVYGTSDRNVPMSLEASDNESMALVSPATPIEPMTADLAIDALTRMYDGCLFLTICSKPHFQLMFLSEDNHRLQWYTHIGGELDRLHSLPLEEVIDVKYLDVVFLIKHKKGLLKLGATNSDDLYYWFIGLKTLMQPDFMGSQVLVVPPQDKKSFIPRLTELYGKIEEKKEVAVVKVKKQRKQRKNSFRSKSAIVSTIPFVPPKSSRPESTPPVQDVKIVPQSKNIVPRPVSSVPKLCALKLSSAQPPFPVPVPHGPKRMWVRKKCKN